MLNNTIFRAGDRVGIPEVKKVKKRRKIEDFVEKGYISITKERAKSTIITDEGHKRVVAL